MGGAWRSTVCAAVLCSCHDAAVDSLEMHALPSLVLLLALHAWLVAPHDFFSQVG
jgi:hypothetical protein